MVAAIIVHQFFHTDLSDVVIPCATFTFVALAFIPPDARRLLAAASFSIALAGTSYFRYVRQDALGIGVALATMAISLSVVLIARRLFPTI